MSSGANLVFDALLAAALVWLAFRVLFASGDFKAVVLFIAYGLLMSLVWLRLSAPDVALAEAAIGAGLTGVLLIDALRVLSASGRPSSKGSDGHGH